MGIRVVHGECFQPEHASGRPMESNGNISTQTVYEQILELHGCGCKSEEIAVQILRTEPETAVLLVGLLVEIIVEDVRRFVGQRSVMTYVD